MDFEDEVDWGMGDDDVISLGGDDIALDDVAPEPAKPAVASKPAPSPPKPAVEAPKAAPAAPAEPATRPAPPSAPRSAPSSRPATAASSPAAVPKPPSPPNHSNSPRPPTGPAADRGRRSTPLANQAPPPPQPILPAKASIPAAGSDGQPERDQRSEPPRGPRGGREADMRDMRDREQRDRGMRDQRQQREPQRNPGRNVPLPTGLPPKPPLLSTRNLGANNNMATSAALRDARNTRDDRPVDRTDRANKDRETEKETVKEDDRPILTPAVANGSRPPARRERRATPSDDADDDLPPNWQRVLSNSTGTYFYHNRVTGATSWDKPTADNEKKDETKTDSDRDRSQRERRDQDKPEDAEQRAAPAAPRNDRERQPQSLGSLRDRLGGRLADRIDRPAPGSHSPQRQEDAALSSEHNRPSPPVHPDRARSFQADRPGFPSGPRNDDRSSIATRARSPTRAPTGPRTDRDRRDQRSERNGRDDHRADRGPERSDGSNSTPPQATQPPAPPQETPSDRPAGPPIHPSRAAAMNPIRDGRPGDRGPPRDMRNGPRGGFHDVRDGRDGPRDLRDGRRDGPLQGLRDGPREGPRDLPRDGPSNAPLPPRAWGPGSVNDHRQGFRRDEPAGRWPRRDAPNGPDRGERRWETRPDDRQVGRQEGKQAGRAERQDKPATKIDTAPVASPTLNGSSNPPPAAPPVSADGPSDDAGKESEAARRARLREEAEAALATLRRIEAEAADVLAPEEAQKLKERANTSNERKPEAKLEAVAEAKEQGSSVEKTDVEPSGRNEVATVNSNDSRDRERSTSSRRGHGRGRDRGGDRGAPFRQPLGPPPNGPVGFGRDAPRQFPAPTSAVGRPDTLERRRSRSPQPRYGPNAPGARRDRSPGRDTWQQRDNRMGNRGGPGMPGNDRRAQGQDKPSSPSPYSFKDLPEGYDRYIPGAGSDRERERERPRDQRGDRDRNRRDRGDRRDQRDQRDLRDQRDQRDMPDRGPERPGKRPLEGAMYPDAEKRMRSPNTGGGVGGAVPGESWGERREREMRERERR